MNEYRDKPYGRNQEVAELFRLFGCKKNISMHGPRRLGKTFVLERMTEQGDECGYLCVKIELAGVSTTDTALKMLCEAMEKHHKKLRTIARSLVSRGKSILRPTDTRTRTFQEILTSFDWEPHLEKLLGEANLEEKRWAFLIDELPIFLKALHDRGESGIAEARNFMNLLSRLMSTYPNIRWLVTGSIGISQLAKIGNYQGVISKFESYPLDTLTHDQAVAFVLDLPNRGMLQHREIITPKEAEELVHAVGWRSAYYLEGFANHLPRTPETDPQAVEKNIAKAQESLIKDTNAARFNSWEEHIRKHHGVNKEISFACLAELCKTDKGMSLDGLMGVLARPDLSRTACLHLLIQLCDEGFLHQDDGEDSPYRFRIPLLRLWWKRYQPST